MHPNHRLTILALALSSLPLATAADVPPPLDKGKTFVTHHVQIQNMKEHPGYSLLVYDPPQEDRIHARLTFNSETESDQHMVSGGSWRSIAMFGAPKIWLLPREQEKQWSAETAKEIDRQREACAERGEGCAHISRFAPRFAPPKGAIDCGVVIGVVTSVPSGDVGKDAKVVDVFRLVEATAKTCKLEHTKRAGGGGR